MQRLEAMAKASSKKSAAKSSPKPSRSLPRRQSLQPEICGGEACEQACRESIRTVAKKAAQAVQAGKWVYTFGDGRAEGKANMRDLLGGKGANLAEMANLGLPVPPGFTIPTSVCTYFYANGKTYPKDLKSQVEKALVTVGKIAGKTFGDAKNPLLVSVRSGGRASMPGMMDTVLNLGLNDTTVEALASSRATAVSPMTAIAASSPCIRMWCSASSIITSRTFSTPTRTARAIRSTPN
jgi:pyruvate,orthophosphate dikinase